MDASRKAGGEPPQEFVITRTVDAPRELVWKAWTEADRLAKWWGPKGCAIRVAKLELKPGGVFLYAMQFQPGNDMWGRFTYREIVPPERLVYVSAFSDANGGLTRAPFSQLKNSWPLEVLNVLTFSEEGGKTTLTLRGSPINATDEECKLYVSMFDSMRGGFAGTFEQLEAYLKTA